VRQDPVLLVLLGGIAAVSVGADPAITLTPSLSHAFGQGVELVGVFASSFGAGAALGFVMLPLVAGRFGLVRLAEIGLLLLSGGSLALAVARAAPLAIAAFAVAGVGMTLALTSLTTQIQQRVPDGVRGRVMALWSIAFLGSRPFAAAVDGAVAEWLSVEAALVAVSLSTLAAACWCRPARLSIRGPEV
jgi:MFS family permease